MNVNKFTVRMTISLIVFAGCVLTSQDVVYETRNKAIDPTMYLPTNIVMCELHETHTINGRAASEFKEKTVSGDQSNIKSGTLRYCRGVFSQYDLVPLHAR